MRRPFRTGTGKKVVLSWMASYLPSYFQRVQEGLPRWPAAQGEGSRDVQNDLT